MSSNNPVSPGESHGTALADACLDCRLLRFAMANRMLGSAGDRTRLPRLLVGFFALAEQRSLQLELVEVNGQPGATMRDPDGRLVNVHALDIADGLVTALRSVIDPDKLGHLGPVSDLARVAARRPPGAMPVCWRARRRSAVRAGWRGHAQPRRATARGTKKDHPESSSRQLTP